MLDSKIGPINSKNVHMFMEMVRRDKNLRSEAISGIKRGLPSFVEKTFNLTPTQRKEMHRKMPKDTADIAGRACVLALQHNGKIEFRITRKRRVPSKPNLRIEIYARGGEIGIRITWEK